MVLSEQPETKMLALALSRFVTGSASRLCQHTNVDLNNKYIVLDISEMGKELLHLMVKSSVAQNKMDRDTIQLDFLQKACIIA